MVVLAEPKGAQFADEQLRELQVEVGDHAAGRNREFGAQVDIGNCTIEKCWPRHTADLPSFTHLVIKELRTKIVLGQNE